MFIPVLGPVAAATVTTLPKTPGCGHNVHPLTSASDEGKKQKQHSTEVSPEPCSLSYSLTLLLSYSLTLLLSYSLTLLLSYSLTISLSLSLSLTLSYSLSSLSFFFFPVMSCVPSCHVHDRSHTRLCLFSRSREWSCSHQGVLEFCGGVGRGGNALCSNTGQFR